MDMNVVQFIDNKNRKDIDFYDTVDKLFPNNRYPLLTSTMFKCFKPGNFSGLYELYAVNNLPWRAILLKYQEKDMFVLYMFKPIVVGYLQSSYNLKEWRPSLDESCFSALEYIIKEDRNYKDCCNQNNKKTINQILSLYNRYYYLKIGDLYRNDEDENFANFDNLKLTPNPEGEPIFHELRWIYNDFYRVYYDAYPLVAYRVALNSLNYRNDKEAYYKEHSFGPKICFWILIIILLVYLLYQIQHQLSNRSKANDLSSKVNVDTDDNISYLYNEILSKANPKMFIEPYKPDKLAIANEIYSEAINNRHNREILEKLLDRIRKELC
jgi:hypothetical protein